jgi:hypothetical protein
MLRIQAIQEAGQRRANYIITQYLMTPMGCLYLAVIDMLCEPTCDLSFQPRDSCMKVTDEEKMEFFAEDSRNLFKLVTELQFFKERLSQFMQCKLTSEGLMSSLTDMEIGELYVASIMRNYYSTIGKRA